MPDNEPHHAAHPLRLRQQRARQNGVGRLGEAPQQLLQALAGRVVRIAARSVVALVEALGVHGPNVTLERRSGNGVSHSRAPGARGGPGPTGGALDTHWPGG